MLWGRVFLEERTNLRSKCGLLWGVLEVHWCPKSFPSAAVALLRTAPIPGVNTAPESRSPERTQSTSSICPRRVDRPKEHLYSTSLYERNVRLTWSWSRQLGS